MRDQDRRRAAQRRGAEAHRRRPQGLQRRRHRARRAVRRAGRRLQPDALRPVALRAAALRQLRRAVLRPRATRGPSAADAIARAVAKDFVVDDAMVAEFKKYVESRRMKIDEAAWTPGPGVHPRDDPLRDRRRRSSASGVARRRLLEVDPQAQHALGLFPQAEKLLTHGQDAHHAYHDPAPTQLESQFWRPPKCWGVRNRLATQVGPCLD